MQQHKLQEQVYREKILTVEELQQHITEEWERLDQRIIDNAVKHWLKPWLIPLANERGVCR